MAEQSARDLLRSKTVGKEAVFQKELVEYDGSQLEVREPTVSIWSKIVDKSRPEENADLDLEMFTLWTVILCTYVPGTDELVYEEDDYESLSKQPRTGFMGKLNNAATKILAPSQFEAIKNLKATTSD